MVEQDQQIIDIQNKIKSGASLTMGEQMAINAWSQQMAAQAKADAGNMLLSGAAKAGEWALAGLLHGGKKGSPWAPLDEWEAPWNNPELSYAKPWTWDWDPGNQHGALTDFWTSWKPDIADIPGELASFARPFWKGAPEWGQKWSEEHDFYPLGSTGDSLGLAGVGGFTKNPEYSKIQEQLLNSTPEEVSNLGYVKLMPNPIYKNISDETFSTLMANIPNNQFDISNQQFISALHNSNPFISEGMYNQLNEWGLNILEDQKKDGFYVSQDFLTPKQIDLGDGNVVTQSPYQIFMDITNHNADKFLYNQDGTFNEELKDRFMNNPLLWSTIARDNSLALGGDMNSVIMDLEDKATNFSHDKFMDASAFLGPDRNWEDQASNPMAITTPPMMSPSLPFVGEIFEGEAEDEGIINEFKRKVGLGDIKPGTMFMDLMHEQYPFGDPEIVKDIKSDIATRGAAGSPDPEGATGIENLILNFPEALALTAGGKMKFPSKIMNAPFGAGAPWNVFTPSRIFPYSKKTPLSIYKDIKKPIPLEGIEKDLKALEQ